MNIFLHIITNNIVPIFILICTGVILGKRFSLDVATLSKLNFYAFMPFFSFVVIYTNDLSINMGKTLLFAVVFMIINSILAYAAAAMRKIDNRKKHILVNSVILYNSGNIGIPLITLIYTGTPYLNQALVVQITIMLVQALAGATIGFYNAGRTEMHWKDSIISVLKMPAIYAIILASVLKLFNYDLTENFIWPAFVYIKQAMIGFVLITLGVQLSITKIKGRDPDISTAVILRLLAGPLAALLIIKMIGITGILAQVLFISSAAPTAITSALIAIERKVEPDFAAKVVMFSTIACSITLVFVVFFSTILFPV